MKAAVFKAKILAQLSIRQGKTRLNYYPYKVTIEPTNVCNLGCALCPSGTHSLKAPLGFMKIDTMKAIVKELRPHLDMVSLYNWGEPLFHPNILYLIEICNNADIEVRISTHLMQLEPEVARGLAHSRLRKVFISCNGASAESYKVYHTKGDFQKVIENMTLLLEERKRAHATWDVVWLFHVFRHNEHEIEKALAFSKSLGIKIQFNPMRTDMGKEIFETRAQAIERDGKWIPENPQFNKYINPDIPVHTFCKSPWTEVTIAWDGRVLPCCGVYEIDKYSFGNILTEGIQAIWNGRAYVSVREELLGLTQDSGTICTACRRSGFLHF